MTPAPPPASPLELWNQTAQSLPPGLPDSGYDAQREKFFQTTIMPWAMQKGFNTQVAREEFMKNSERAGKSSFPRLDLAARSAVDEAAAPVLGLGSMISKATGPDQPDEPQALRDKLSGWVDQARAEAQRQGVGTGIPEAVGRMVGMAPAFAAAGPLGEGVAGFTGSEVLGNIAGISAASGAMSAAKAEDGQRLIKGFEGAAEGAALGGAIELGGSALGLLRSTPAQAMEKTVKGVATPEEQEVARAATVAIPDLPDQVVKQAASDVKGAQEIGVPSTPPQVQKGGSPLATFKTTSGQTYQLPADQLAERISAGDSLEQIAGSATEIQGALKTAEKQAAKNGKLGQTKVAPIAPGKSAGTDTFEPTAIPVRPEGVVASPPSSAPSTFTGWSSDYMERYLQQNMLDFSLDQSGREAAGTRLAKLAPAEYSKVTDFLAAGGGKVESQAIPVGGLGEVDAPLSPTADSPTFLPLYQSISNKGEVNVNSLVSRGGLTLDDATTMIEQAKAAGLLQESGQIIKGGGAEVIQKYRVVPTKVSEVPAFDKGVKSAIENTPYDPIDGLLDRLRKQLVEQHPEWRDEMFPESEQAAEPVTGDEGPSDLEQQLRGSLERLKFPGVKFGQGGAQDTGGLPPMNPSQVDTRVFQRAGQKTFVETLTEIDPTITPEEATRYYQWNVVQKNASPKYRPDYLNLRQDEEDGSLGQTVNTLVPGKTIIKIPEAGASRGVLFHEGLHSNFYNTGLHEALPEVMDDTTTSDLFTGGFQPEVRDWYAKHTPEYVPEEVYVHTAQAYRSGDRQMLQNFADADTDRETLDSWFAGKTRELIGLNSAIPDSVSKRILDRRLNDLVNRSGGSLEQMSMQPAALGSEVDFNDGRWEVRDQDQTVHKFDSREDLADYLYDNHAPPVNVPELLDLSGLPEGIRGPAARPHGPRAPIGTQPPPPELRPGRDVKAGASTFSFYFRPFYSWVDSVADRFKWGALSEVMGRVQDSELQMNNALRPYHEVLGDTLGKIPQNRQSLLFKVLEARPEDKASVADTLGLTGPERETLTSFNEKFVAPLESELGVNLEHFVGKYQGQSRMGLDEMSSETMTNRASAGPMKFLGDAWRTGELDPRDQNLLNVASEYVRLGMRKKFMETPLVDAAKLVNSEESGTYIAGNLQPLLARHINYLRGIPDYSARVIHEATGTVMNLINEGIEQANKALPESWKLSPLDGSPKEALNKWIAFSYAGGLMYRPMVLIRNAMQYFITTFPILGAKYTIKGLEKFSGSLSKETGDEIWQTAQKYGALLGDRELMRYQTGQEAESVGGAVGQAVDRNVQRWMGMMQWSHNVNRLAAFWGHAERIKDAMAESAPGEFLSGQDSEAFAKQAGLNYLTKMQKGKYLEELPHLNTADRQSDFAYRAAKDLVDVSQWNYSRGAAPGGYKYALGKLFGQYGTWPLNYIEWARRVAGSGDAQEKVATLTRLALAHTAILKAGESMGIDTAGWTFTQPGAYGGGPLFSAVTSGPAALDFETEKGADARRNVIRPIWPMAVPGGLAAESIFKAIHDDDPNVWKIILGFHPMKPAEYGRGLHLLPPETEPR